MLAEDINPNRLDRTKQIVSKIIDKLEGDRIGIVVFAGDAYVQLPITTDYAAAKMMLSAITTDMIPVQGTAIGAAINKCIESFQENKARNKAIILFSDGENHEDNPEEVVDVALEKGIVVNTVGIGSVNGVPIPVYSNGIKTGYKKDKEGNIIMTKLEESVLQYIASKGRGTYIRMTNSNAGMEAIMDVINRLEKKEITSSIYSEYEDKFYYFGFIGLIIMLLEIFIFERKNKWLNYSNIFKKGILTD